MSTRFLMLKQISCFLKDTGGVRIGANGSVRESTMAHGTGSLPKKSLEACEICPGIIDNDIHTAMNGSPSMMSERTGKNGSGKSVGTDNMSAAMAAPATIDPTMDDQASKTAATMTDKTADDKGRAAPLPFDSPHP